MESNKTQNAKRKGYKMEFKIVHEKEYYVVKIDGKTAACCDNHLEAVKELETIKRELNIIEE